MQAEVQEDSSQGKKQIKIMILIYLLLAFVSFYTQEYVIRNSLIKTLQDQQLPAPSVKHLLSIFSNKKYEGTWNSLDTTEYDNALTKDRGKFLINILKYGTNEKQKYDVMLDIYNGIYISQGAIVLNFQINPNHWQSFRNGSNIYLMRKNADKIGSSADKPDKLLPVQYQHNLLFQNLQEYKLEAQNISFSFGLTKKSNSLEIGIQIDSQQVSVAMVIARQESNVIESITFASMLIIILFMQFFAVMRILKNIIEGQDQPANYSLITILIVMMWDATLCMLSFIQAFKSQANFILFIMPAFFLCILFTNMELRLVLLVFVQLYNNDNMRQVICKFNLLSYGSLILIYPILYYTNLSTLFFLMISLLFLPQLYLNGVNSRRPDMNNPLYKEILATRLVTILYLKCFPWNVFEIEPDYLLGFSCVSLIALQMFCLWIQKVYGPRRIFPKFLMPPSYDYQWKAEKSEQLANASYHQSECSICLSSLNNDQQATVPQFRVPFKIMKAPCGHKYHGACLSEWMEVKMQCPQCRSKLPPYQ